MARDLPDPNPSRTPAHVAAALSPPVVVYRPRRVLPVLALCFCAGIWLGALVPLPPWCGLASAFLFLLLAMAGRASAWAALPLHLAVVFAGMVWVDLASGRHDPVDLSRLLQRDRESALVTGRVVEMPVLVDLDQRGRPHWSMACAAEALGGRKATGSVRMFMEAVEGQPAPQYGDRWSWQGTIRPDRRPLPERRGVVAVMHADPGRSVRVAADTGSRFAAWCMARRAEAHERLGWGLPEASASVALARAMLLGYRQDIDRTVHDAFLRTGTLHILALSGMHVGILVFLMGMVLTSFGVTRSRWIFWVAPVLVCYTVGTGAAPSMVRSTIMALVYFSAYAFRRRPDAISALAGAALLILAVDPLQLFDAGFILSFVSVGGLVSLYPLIAGRLDRMLAGDPWEAVDRVEDGWRRTLREGLCAAFAVSLAAWLATLPLVIWLSNIISPVSLIVNLAMGPASFLLLLTECLAALSGFVSYQVAVTFNHAHDVFATLLLEGIQAVARLPGGFWYVATWPAVMIGGWYGLLVVAAVARAWWRGVAVAGLAVLVVGSMGWRAWSDEVELVCIPAGEAEVVVLDGPGDRVVLVDAGPAYQHRRVIRALRARGINRIDALLITRANSDAYGAVASLAESMEIREVVHPWPQVRQPVFEAQVARWQERLGAERVRPWPHGTQMAEAPGVVIERVWPEGEAAYRNARTSPLVMRISHGHRAVLVAGRLEAALERRLLELPLDWSATGLVVSRCEDDRALGDAWLDAVSPGWVRINLGGFQRLPWGDRAIRDRLSAREEIRVVEPGQDPFVWRF